MTDHVNAPDGCNNADSDSPNPSLQDLREESNEMTTNSHEPITLNDFIKTSGLVGTGGQAKMLIQSGEVMVNGVWETRRRRKLLPGDAVELLGRKVIVDGSGGSP